MRKIVLTIFIITSFAGVLRFYQLSNHPIQLNHDEISQLYDLESVAQTGKDIYGNHLPLTFPSTGDYKVGHYIYISLLPYLIFSDQEFTIRIPAALFGTLIIPVVFLFVFQLTKNISTALISALLVAISPSEIFYARKSFENVIGIFLIYLGLFLIFLESRKRVWTVLGFISLGLAMYTYTSHVIVVPLLIISIFLIYNQINKNIKYIYIWAAIIFPLIILSIFHPDLRFRANSVFFTKDYLIGEQLSFISSNNFFINLIYQIRIYFDHLFIRYLNHFDPTYLFANGLNLTNQGPIGIGPLYFWQLPLVILGFIYLLKSKLKLQRRLLFAFMFISVIPSVITFETLSPHRSIFAFSVLSIISAFGVLSVVNFIKSLSLSRKFPLFILSVLILVLNLVYFIHMYTINYPYEKSQHLHYPFKQISQFVWENYNGFDRIIIDPIYGQAAPVQAVAIHYYLAYYGNYPVEKFQQEYQQKNQTDGIFFDKFEIRRIYWPKDKDLKNVLILTSPWSIEIDKVNPQNIIKQFHFYDNQIAYYAIKT